MGWKEYQIQICNSKALAYAVLEIYHHPHPTVPAIKLGTVMEFVLTAQMPLPLMKIVLYVCAMSDFSKIRHKSVKSVIKHVLDAQDQI